MRNMQDSNEIRDNSQHGLNAAELGLRRQEREHQLTHRHRKKSLMNQRIQDPGQERVDGGQHEKVDLEAPPSDPLPPKNYYPQHTNEERHKYDPVMPVPRRRSQHPNNLSFMYLNIGVVIGFLIGALMMFMVQLRKQQLLARSQ